MNKKGSYYRAKHARLTFQLGSRNKATVAIANRMARAIYHIIKVPGLRFKELGALRVEPREHQIKRRLGQLRALGLNVQHEPNGTILLSNAL